MTCRSKSSVIREMVELADRTGLLCYRDELLESLVEREKLCTTALSGGLALLHPRNHEPYMFEDSFVVLGKTHRTDPVRVAGPLDDGYLFPDLLPGRPDPSACAGAPVHDVPSNQPAAGNARDERSAGAAPPSGRQRTAGHPADKIALTGLRGRGVRGRAVCGPARCDREFRDRRDAVGRLAAAGRGPRHSGPAGGRSSRGCRDRRRCRDRAPGRSGCSGGRRRAGRPGWPRDRRDS